MLESVTKLYCSVPRMVLRVSLLACAGCLVAFGVQMIAAQTASDTKPAAGAASQASDPDQAKKHDTEGFHEPQPIDFANHDGYVQIFDGKTVTNWDGDPAIWRVENGAIVGESTKERPVSNSYIAFRGFEAKDFDLKLEIKVETGGGSGIQYRSKTGVPWLHARPSWEKPYNLDWMMTGPQADFWFPVTPATSDFTGQFYCENNPLGIIAWRGEVVNSSPGKKAQLVGNIGDREALGGYVRVNDWNQYMIMARGGTFIHILNGQLMAVYVDDDPDSPNNSSGLVGIEIEGFRRHLNELPYTPVKVSVRNIWIRKLN
jgi:Domain of Unknown Function (DUF1080)